MTGKPKFDPSAPFENGDQPIKPKFDASKPFEAAPQTSLAGPSDGALKTLGKGFIGVATGVGEAMNPLAYPNAFETLVRAPFQDPDPKLGFFGRIGDRFEKARKNAWTKEMRVEDVAPVIRTSIGAVKDIVTGDAKNIPVRYEQEKAAQKDFNENFLPKGTRAAGEIGAGILSLGMLAKQGAKSTNAAPRLAKSAQTQAYDSLKPLGKAADKIVREGRVEAIGKQLLDDKIVTVGASYKDILSRTQSKLDEYGETIGHFAKSADKAVDSDSSIRRILVDDVAKTVSEKLVPRLIEEGASDVAKQVSNWVTDNLKSASGQTGEIGFQQLQKIKTTLAKTKAKFRAANDTVSADAFQDLWGVLNDFHVEGIETALKQAGSADDVAYFIKAKNSFHNLKDAEKFIQETVSRTSKNRFPSLSDYITGGSGGVMGAIIGLGSGSIGTTAGAAGLGTLALGTANKLARTRGNQASASILNNISKVIESGSKPSIIPQVLDKSLAAGTAANLPKAVMEFLEPSVVRPRK